MEIVKIRKQNRIIDIPSSRLNAFLQQGYDQIDEKGRIIKRATGGRPVSISEYNKVLTELEQIKNQDAQKELEELKKEIKNLKTENTKLKKSLEEMKSEK